MSITKSDLQILRELAKKQIELSQTEQNANTKKEWESHGAFKGSRSMIYVELGSFEHEIIPPLLKCETDEAREIETKLYRNFVNHTLFGDDMVVRDYFPIRYDCGMKLFDLGIEREETGGLGHQFIHQITDIKEEFHKFEKPSAFYLDKEKAKRQIDFYSELFGDILPSKLEGVCVYACPTQKIVHLMGMENMLFAMYDYPDEFKAMMDNIANEYIRYFDYLAENKVLLPTRGIEEVYMGTFAYNNELPETVSSTLDVYGSSESQETVNVSPEMFGEFVWPCYEKILSRFGLLSYGCCEPVHSIFDNYLSKLTNLCKVSISPWCDEEFMGERLRGKNIVYHRKPSPNYLGVGTELDEAAVIEHIHKTVNAAKGCALEIAQRDVYTVANNPDKVKRYVEIIRSRTEK